MAGYWNNREATDAVIDPEGWFHTGDIGQADSSGHVFVVDRIKDMVISGGENVYPAVCSTDIRRSPRSQCSPPRTNGGARQLRCVVALQPEATLTLEQLRDFAHNKLASYKLPLRLELIETLPRNTSGKS